MRHAAGDPGGVPLQIEVEISRDFVRDLRNLGPAGREVVGYTTGFYRSSMFGYRSFGACPPGHYHPYGYGPMWSSDVYWSGPAPTTVYLLGGDGPGQGRLLRTELDYGVNVIHLAVTPGRQVTLTVQAYGGYEGWEEIGTFTAATTSGQRVVVDLREHAPQMRVHQPDGTVIDVSPRPVPPSPPAVGTPSASPAAPAPAPAAAPAPAPVEPVTPPASPATSPANVGN